MKPIFTIGAAAFLLLVASCAKKGDTGPAGPKGDTGVQGAAGPQGPAGATGNANVKMYGPFKLPPTAWNYDGMYYRTAIETSAITSDIAAKGSVQVFVLDSLTWWALPYSIADAYFLYGVEPGKIIISHGDSHGNPSLPGEMVFKLILIEPSNKTVKRSAEPGAAPAETGLN